MSDPTALPPSVLAQILTPQTSGQTQTATAQPNAQIIEIPPELLSAPSSQTIIAEVIRQSSEGILTVRADQGDIQLQTSLTFEPRDAVAIRITENDAFIRPLSEALEQRPTSPLLNAQQALPLSVSHIVNAANLFVTPLSRADVQNLVLPFLQVTETQITSPPVTQSAQAVGPTAQTPFSFPEPVAQPDLRVSLPQLEINVPLRAIAAQLPLFEPVTADTHAPRDIAPLQITVTDLKNHVSALQQTQDSLLSTQRAGEIRAVFVGLTPEQHFPAFQTLSEEPQFFALRAPVETIPIGAEITLNVSQTQSVLPLNISLPPIMMQAWHSLNEVQETLIQHAAMQVTQAFQASIPNPSIPAQLTSSVLFFLMAVRSGDVQGWLGDKAVEALKRAGKDALINRLSTEFSAMNRTDSSSGDWRVMSLPLGWNEQIHKVTVSYRKDDERGEDDVQKGTQTRFVMDLSLSAMGKVQLDALFSSSSKRLDLIVRTEGEFSEGARQHMRGVYKSALDETQITGELSFSGKPEGWVNINEGKAPDFKDDV